ncbi:MAG TPA: asparagine synthase (glutamine-hydrolyzing) [Povalibacter sp.]|nr:asparagine synthase (glutamine-hydrolyzing) [Povalibacter sp.]
MNHRPAAAPGCGCGSVWRLERRCLVCGIAGILSLPDAQPCDRGQLRQMIESLAHRGPDGFGYLQEGPVGLAHARLSIIDLSSGDQPIANEDQSVWTVFNGEIFNFIEIRAALERAGHVFRTQSDTETIVHAYEEYGDDFVHHLNGQFVIALWDSRRRRLLLARDRLGIRPLFVQRDGRRILFASEIKAILAVSSQPRRLDVDGLAQVFTFWSTVGERTVFAGIRSVPPGCMLKLEGEREELVHYWHWSHPAAADSSRLSFDEAAEQVRELMSDAVRLQLRADVPVGAYLSGGLDSSIIAALVRTRSDVPLRTFSVVFDDAEFDESSHQQIMVRHLGTQHTSVRCTHGDIAASFPRLIAHTETPIVRTGPVPLMILSEHVRRCGFKVVLSGEGADEVFGGYDLFKEAQIRRFWARRPESRSRPQLLRRLYPYLRHSPVGSAASAESFFGQGLRDVDSPFYGHSQRWVTTRRLHAFLSRDVQAQMAGCVPEAALSEMLPPDFARWSGLSRDQFVEAQTLLFGYLLSSQGDRVAMANSVEGRVPFLDHRVVEFANQLPARYKLRGLKEKAVLRRAFAHLLPPEVGGRVKQPYRSPDIQSFFKDGRAPAWVEELLSPQRLGSAGYFDGSAVQRLLAKCRAGRAIGFADNMAFVGILSTMLVEELFLKRGEAAAAYNAGLASAAAAHN